MITQKQEKKKKKHFTNKSSGRFGVSEKLRKSQTLAVCSKIHQILFCKLAIKQWNGFTYVKVSGATQATKKT